MTDPVPGLIAAIGTPVPDEFQDTLRAAVVSAMTYMATQHQALVDQLDALTARVTVLETPPPAPTPPPTPTP